jgi:tRNA dimethylallyltransferase
MGASEVIAIFGPTTVGKTAVAIELAELLREQGEDPVAVSCDAIQVYRGLEVLSGAPTAAEQRRLEHRLVAVAEPSEEFSAGRYAALARGEIDALLESGRRPIVVGGTGLYLRAALADLELAPVVPAEVRSKVERELEEHGAAALHARLPADVAARIHHNDRKRIARATELHRSGHRPPERMGDLWSTALRHPTLLAGLVIDREQLRRRIASRVEAMIAAGAAEEAVAAVRRGASRTARSALGFEELLAGDREAMTAAHRRYARRQLTWMRRMRGVEVIDRSGLDDRATARRIAGLLA